MVYSYLSCNEEEPCTVYKGFQHIQNLKNGEFLWFYKDGSLKEKGQYNNDIKEGLWHEYYLSGKMQSKIDYIDGNGLYTSFYDRKNSM